MSEPGPRVAAWLGTVADLLREPLLTMPHQVILEQLAATFPVTAVSHNWSDAEGEMGVSTHPVDVLAPLAGQMKSWLRGELAGSHPLIVWYLRTQDPRPWTIGRVPTALVPRREWQRIRQPLRPLELEQQLAINYRLAGSTYSTYVLGRGRIDFTEDDLVVAGYVQRALTGLDRQITLVRAVTDARAEQSGGGAGLSERELAVLGLLADGLSTRAIALLLSCSHRTIDKHLEHAYRKLGVRDRLNAVRAAQRLGLLPT